MSEEAMSLNVEELGIDELAREIQKGNRECMMRMYTILHDDLLAIARKTIQSARQAEFVVRKSFAEVISNHEHIDPDFFELSLIQVLSENARKEDIHNTYTMAVHRSAIQSASTLDSIRQRAVPAKLSATGSMEMVSDYADLASEEVIAPARKKKSLSDTLSMPVLFSSAAAIAATGVGGMLYQNDQVKKKDLSYTQLMESLNMSFLENEDGSEVSEFEYSPNTTKNIEDLVIQHSGNLSTSMKAIDLNRVGSNLVTYSLSNTDKYNQTATMHAVRNYVVKDTQAPVISMNVDSVSITEGDSFDPMSVVGSVADVADGALTYVENEPARLENDSLGRVYEQGWYTVSSNVDASAPGEYAVTVHAVDNHGLVSEASVPVTVTKKKVIATATVTGSASVNTGENANIIYTYLTTEAGFTKAAAAAVLANIQIECTFNPAAGSSYYGLCQWGGGRLNNLIAFCAQNGYASDSVEGQIRFMVQEMGSGMIAQMNSVSDSADGAAEAGVYFRQTYERSAALDNVANLAASFYNSL